MEAGEQETLRALQPGKSNCMGHFFLVRIVRTFDKAAMYTMIDRLC